MRWSRLCGRESCLGGLCGGNWGRKSRGEEKLGTCRRRRLVGFDVVFLCLWPSCVAGGGSDRAEELDEEEVKTNLRSARLALHPVTRWNSACSRGGSVASSSVHSRLHSHLSISCRSIRTSSPPLASPPLIDHPRTFNTPPTEATGLEERRGGVVRVVEPGGTAAGETGGGGERGIATAIWACRQLWGQQQIGRRCRGEVGHRSNFR